MSYLQIKLDGASDEFKRGVKAALDFFDGADAFQVYHSDADSITVEVPEGDNASYAIEGDRIVFDSTGVEL